MFSSLSSEDFCLPIASSWQSWEWFFGILCKLGFMPRLDGALSNLIKWDGSLPTSGVWNEIVLRSLLTQTLPCFWFHWNLVLGPRKRDVWVTSDQEKMVTWNGAVIGWGGDLVSASGNRRGKQVSWCSGMDLDCKCVQKANGLKPLLGRESRKDMKRRYNATLILVNCIKKGCFVPLWLWRK